jgi:hypothetical protein
MDPLSALSNLFSNLFSNPSAPYQDASNAYSKYANMGANAMNPFMQGGSAEIPQYQAWLKSMSNPMQFQNNLMSQYQESPNAKFMQQQAIRSAQNAGSAEGTVGSSPYNLQVQQNASNISQQDMHNWMSNVLGLNTQYGSGLGNMMNMGEQGANSLLSLYGNEAGAQGNAAYGAAAAQNNNQGNIFSDIANLF